jgi:hypothetical protein
MLRFRLTGKAMGQVYQCWWSICRVINVVFQFRISHILLLILFMAYLLTLPLNLTVSTVSEESADCTFNSFNLE